MIVSGSGKIDLRLPIFASGKVPVMIVTTTAGATQLPKQKAAAGVEIRAARSSGAIRPSSILGKVRRDGVTPMITPCQRFAEFRLLTDCSSSASIATNPSRYMRNGSAEYASTGWNLSFWPATTAFRR